jgi:hypothetical protein
MSPAVERGVVCRRAGVAPAVGGKRPQAAQAAQAAGRKRQAGATTAGFCIRLKSF